MASGHGRRTLRTVHDFMHSTLTEQARCLFGDEHRPTPDCGFERREHLSVEELAFADADAILAMLHELWPQVVDGHLPVRVRNLVYRLLLLQRPDEPALLQGGGPEPVAARPGPGWPRGRPGRAGRVPGAGLTTVRVPVRDGVRRAGASGG